MYRQPKQYLHWLAPGPIGGEAHSHEDSGDAGFDIHHCHLKTPTQSTSKLWYDLKPAWSVLPEGRKYSATSHSRSLLTLHSETRLSLLQKGTGKHDH